MARNVGEMKMLIREPLVHATYYYLRETPGDNAATTPGTGRCLYCRCPPHGAESSSWLAIPVPELPSMSALEVASPSDVQPLMPARVLEGRTDAAALVGAYALRNMLLLRVMVMRVGSTNKPYGRCSMRYWANGRRLLPCSIPPATGAGLLPVPGGIGAGSFTSVKTPYGVLCLSREESAHLLIYPDARTETRASTFLQSLAVRLDWYPVQARYCLNRYLDHVPVVARNQQQALEQVARSIPAGQSYLHPWSHFARNSTP